MQQLSFPRRPRATPAIAALSVLSVSALGLWLLLHNDDPVVTVLTEYRFPYCDCVRRSEANASLTPSSCSEYSSSRGPGQKIVSYSFYGHSQRSEEVSRKFFRQISSRAKDVSKFYPGWIMRVYFRADAEDDFEGLRGMCEMWCRFENLDFCDVADLPQPFGDLFSDQPVGKLWRFSVMFDPLVDVFISRDLDSTILPREAAAVGEWLASNKTFHVMRDHPSHNGHMMAGLWGARNSADRRLLATLGNQMLLEPAKSYWGYDQALLRRLVWPLAKSSLLQHDSFTCTAKEFKDADWRAFPTRREGLYVGWGPVKGSANETGITDCPVECRPQRHRDWTQC